MQESTDIVLSLGANFGNRRANLRSGLDRLKQVGFVIDKISPTVESPAQLPPKSPAEWNRPFLNLVTTGTTDQDYDGFRRAIKVIQQNFSKPGQSKWSPRELDIDIVAWGWQHSSSNQRQVEPIYTRPYVLSPLLHIAPSWPVAQNTLTAHELSLTDHIDFHIPLWMGILNITPDSFSDGGRFSHIDEVRREVEHQIASGVHIIDVGAESTRPHAAVLSDDEEWQRLAPVLELVKEVCSNSPLPPAISVDTYHPRTAEQVLHLGVDMINDVTGLRNDHMLALARDSGKTFIAMHSVTVPADPQKNLEQKEDVCQTFEAWIKEGQRLWEKNGLDLDKIIVDPGIGFGKSSLQSLELMRSVQRFRRSGHRVLVGHSRKRFLKSFAKHESAQLDLETISASMNLCAQSVDILRVHNVAAHVRAYLSWAHLLANKGEGGA